MGEDWVYLGSRLGEEGKEAGGGAGIIIVGPCIFWCNLERRFMRPIKKREKRKKERNDNGLPSGAKLD